MKRIIMFVLLFAALKVAGQTTGYLRFDTVKIMRQNGTCELYVINNTKDSLGLLTNVGGGLTRFIKPKMLNDSMLIVGLDTLTIHGAGAINRFGLEDNSATANRTFNANGYNFNIDSVGNWNVFSKSKTSGTDRGALTNFGFNTNNSINLWSYIPGSSTRSYGFNAYGALTQMFAAGHVAGHATYVQSDTLQVILEADPYRLYMFHDSTFIGRIDAGTADVRIRTLPETVDTSYKSLVSGPKGQIFLRSGDAGSGGGGGDSSIFSTNYRRDTAIANVRDQIATKLTASDTANRWVNDIRRSSDSVYALKNGTWQFKYKDSVGTGGGTVTPGIQTSITGTAVNYDPRVNSNLIFNDFLLTTIGPKWDASNAPNTTITFSNGHMRLVGGNATDYIYDSTTTIIHRWTEEVRAVIQSVGGSDYFALGIQSQGIQTIYFKIKASDLSSTVTYNNGATTLGTTAAQGTTVVGDSVIYRIRRDNYTLYFDVINVTQSTSQTLTYNYTNIDAVSGTVIPFRAFSITLNPVAGTIDIDYVKLYNQERIYADWLVIGHSIAEGFNAGAPDSTFYNRLQNYFPDKRFGLYAISGSKAADFNLPGSQKNDMLALRAKRALIVLGVNEIQAGTTTQTFINNMRALVDTLENHNTQVIVCNTTPYNATNKSAIIAYNSALLTEFGTQLINIYDTLEVDGLMQSSNDSLHPDAQGHRYLFNVLKDEITRLANNPYDPEGIIRIFPRGIEAGSKLGVQSNFGYVPLNLGNSGTSGPGIGYNVKFQSTNTYKYLNSDYANLVQLGLAGKMIFKVAPSGTAGDPITFIDAVTITPAGDVGNGETTPLAPYHIKRSQAGKTTLGEASMLILDNTSGGTGQRQEIGMGYRNANAYSPVVLGNVVTSNTDFTISDFYIATRALTTNTTPIERFRIKSSGEVGINTTTPTWGLDVQRSMGANKDSIPLVSATGSNSVLLQDTTNGRFQRISASTFATVLKGTTNWTPGVVAAGSSTTTTITVTGAVVGDPVTVSKLAGYSNGEIYDAFVSATNTVTLRVHNVSTGSANYSSAADYNVVVLKY